MITSHGRTAAGAPTLAILNLDAFRRERTGPTGRLNSTDWDSLARQVMPAHAEVKPPKALRYCRTARLEADLDRLLDELRDEVEQLVQRSDAVMIDALREA